MPRYKVLDTSQILPVTKVDGDAAREHCQHSSFHVVTSNSSPNDVADKGADQASGRSDLLEQAQLHAALHVSGRLVQDVAC